MQKTANQQTAPYADLGKFCSKAEADTLLLESPDVAPQFESKLHC